MMADKVDVSGRLQNLEQILQTLTGELAPLFRDDSNQVSSWQRGLEAVSQSLKEQTLRIAVVGAVKSGKSTFINALLGHDLLKRGAGIVTAFITRIRSGPEGGWIEVKSWSEINGEVNEAVNLMGLPPFHPEEGSLDLRRASDRDLLRRALGEAQRERPLGRDTFDPNIVLLNAYLEGFSALGEHVGDAPARIEFTAADLHRHRDYVSQESQAVYLKDMELQVPMPWLGDSVEIGDCQGSDSPNPFHFAMLQEYLLGSHCILYLISSRVGVRQADLKLLEAIRVLRLLPQTLFIFNVDLDEHETREDLARLCQRAAQELGLVSPEAKIYTFSTLLHLLESLAARGELSARELKRLEGWDEEKALVDDSHQGFEKFRSDVQQLLDRERVRLLYGGVIGHLQRLTQSMKDAVNTRQGLLSRGLEDLRDLGEEIRKRQDSVRAVLTTVENTMDGMRASLKEEVGAAVDSYFDIKYGAIVGDTMNLIKSHSVNFPDQRSKGEGRQLLSNLYLFYQDFRKALSRHLVDRVNLRIIDFAKNEEEKIEKPLLEASQAYWELLGQALRQYRGALVDLGLNVDLETPAAMPAPRRPPFKPPPFSAFLQESEALGRGSLLLRFGAGRLRQLLSGVKDRVLRRSAADRKASSQKLLQEAIGLVKKETQKELLESFRDYRQNFKFAYLFSFVDRYSQALLEVFRDFGEAALVDIGHLQEAARQRGDAHQDVSEDLAIVQQRLRYAEEQLQALEEGMS